MLQITGNTPQERFLSAVRELKLRFPVKEICEKTGYSDGTVSGYMNNRKVSPQFLRKFAEVYKLDFYELMEGKKKPVQEQEPEPVKKEEPLSIHDRYILNLEQQLQEARAENKRLIKEMEEKNSNELSEFAIANNALLKTLLYCLGKLRSEIGEQDLNQVLLGQNIILSEETEKNLKIHKVS